MNKIKVAIIGVGNCASSLIQGLHYYENNSCSDSISIMHKTIGKYGIEDIEIVVAFDIDKRKVGLDISEAIFTKSSGCWVEFRKDIYNTESLRKRELNERQIDALFFFKTKGEITSSEYAQKYNISDRTARRDLSELIEEELLKNEGDTNHSKYIFP